MEDEVQRHPARTASRTSGAARRHHEDRCSRRAPRTRRRSWCRWSRARRAQHFDVIHSHLDVFGFPGLMDQPAVSTMHGRLDVGLYGSLLRTFPAHPLVSISDAQRVPVPWASWYATVYHGLPLDEYPYTAIAGDYFAFVGRMSPEKRPHVAIDIARRAGVRLLLAAKVDHVDREYFATMVKPRLGEPGIEALACGTASVGGGGAVPCDRGDFLEGLEIRNLRVGDATLDMTLHRHREDVGLNVQRRAGDVEVVAVK